MDESLELVFGYFDSLVDVFEDIGNSDKLKYEDVYRVQSAVLKRLKFIAEDLDSDALKDEIADLRRADPYDMKYLRIDE